MTKNLWPNETPGGEAHINMTKELVGKLKGIPPPPLPHPVEKLKTPKQ